MAADELFSKNLLLRVMRDQIQRQGAFVKSLPEAEPLGDEQEQILDQVAEMIRFIGDKVDRDQKFNSLVDGFVRVADKQGFEKLIDKVFVDDITWGRIAVLMCVVGKCIAKAVAELVSRIVSWTFDFFRDKLLGWIHNRGGWVNSISSLARWSFEWDVASSTCLISPPSVVIFISGLLLGGFIVWRLNKCA